MADLAAIATQPALHVLLVEDDAGIGRVLTRAFRDRGITLEWLRVGAGVVERVRGNRYDAIVLDLMLPDANGFDLCRDIRSLGEDTPICMLTARDALEDKLDGFDVGADDYLTKPFAIDELVARLKALQRRRQPEPAQAMVEFAALRIDVAAREARIADVTIELTRREFDLLVYLTRNAQAAVSREELLTTAWGSARELTLNAVDVYVGYLRRKLRTVDDAPEIKAVRGIGFKLC